MTAPPPDLVVRRSVPADRQQVVELLGLSLGRDPDPRYEQLFAWKHAENPFGASPAWVACDGDRLAGFRVLMRWEFVLGGRVVRAVRAVDTATHPDYQGRGVFTALTMHALGELHSDGVAFVFNTPNDQSRPGYLKMGWQLVGRLPTAVRPTGPAALARLVSARVPADRWSTPSTAGEPAIDVLGDDAELRELIESLPTPRGLRTRLGRAFLGWRYGTPLLGYRAVVAPGGVRRGVALFRVRRRGSAREAALGEVLGPDRRTVARLTHAVRRAADADYLIRLGGGAVAPGGLVRLPRQGPVLAWRAVAEPAMPESWNLSLGDVELF